MTDDVRKAILASAEGLRRSADRIEYLASYEWEDSVVLYSYFLTCSDIMGSVHMQDVYKAFRDVLVKNND